MRVQSTTWNRSRAQVQHYGRRSCVPSRRASTHKRKNKDKNTNTNTNTNRSIGALHFWQGQASLTPAQWVARGVIFYVVLFLTARAMGQRSIANLRFIDFTSAIVIGNLVAHPLSDSRVPFSGALLALLVFASFRIILTRLSTFRPNLRTFLEPKPIKLVENGEILPEGLARARIGHNVLMSELRLNGSVGPEEVAVAALEPNGQDKRCQEGCGPPREAEGHRDDGARGEATDHYGRGRRASRGEPAPRGTIEGGPDGDAGAPRRDRPPRTVPRVPGLRRRCPRRAKAPCIGTPGSPPGCFTSSSELPP